MPTPGALSRWRPTARRLPRFVASAALVVLTVVGGGWLDDLADDSSGFDRPFLVAGRTGEDVDARTLDVAVLGIRGGALLQSFSAKRDTAGLWLLVRVRVTARTEPTALGWAQLTDGRGRRFRLTGRVSQPMTFASSQPGLPLEGEIVFEVPRDLTGPLSVQLSASRTDQRMDAVAEVALPGPGPETVKAWAADQRLLKIAEPGS